MWGRSVFDNIRKFLQFQLTVNVVALLLVFIGAAAGFGQPLTAVQMLWVNLIMDTLGALALGTEKPTPVLLQRKPYKRTASLVSRPMWRNIFAQSAYQLALLFALLFAGAKWFDVHDMSTNPCFNFSLKKDVDDKFNVQDVWEANCEDLFDLCNPDTTSNKRDSDCLYKSQDVVGIPDPLVLADLGGGTFQKKCLECTPSDTDYTHGTIIFNAFIWCQIFNEYTAREIQDEWNVARGLTTNLMFLYVSIFSIGAQVLIVEFGSSFTSTSPLTITQWLWTILLGWISMFFGVGMRFIPVEEDPKTFFLQHGESEDSVPNKGVEMKPV
jgi:magnesium-transporting ATPase (P-type)